MHDRLYRNMWLRNLRGAVEFSVKAGPRPIPFGLTFELSVMSDFKDEFSTLFAAIEPKWRNLKGADALALIDLAIDSD